MLKKPEISIVIPYYNADKTLARAVKSILNQTFTNLELILVNNNSTDNSEAVAKKFSETDSRIILAEEKRQGVVFASNTGMQLAVGKYIARTDADDYSYPEKLRLQYNFLEENKETGLVGTRVNYCENKKNEGLKLYVEYTNNILTHEEIFLNRFIELQVINPSIMFRKEIADRYGYYKAGDFPEDFELFLRWLSEGVKFAKLPNFLFDWYDTDKRLTRTDERYSVDAFYRIKTPYLAGFLKEINPHYPYVAIWGAGKVSQRRAEMLKAYGIKFVFFIDIDPKKAKKENVILYNELPPPGKYFILSYAGRRDAKDKIRLFLKSRNYIEGVDFLIIS